MRENQPAQVVVVGTKKDTTMVVASKQRNGN
jgi:hypothetical protein